MFTRERMDSTPLGRNQVGEDTDRAGNSPVTSRSEHNLHTQNSVNTTFRNATVQAFRRFLTIQRLLGQTCTRCTVSRISDVASDELISCITAAQSSSPRRTSWSVPCQDAQNPVRHPSPDPTAPEPSRSSNSWWSLRSSRCSSAFSFHPSATPGSLPGASSASPASA